MQSCLLLFQVALSVVLVAWFTNTETFHNMLTGLKETAAPTSQPEMSAMDHLNLPHLQQVLSVHVGEYTVGTFAVDYTNTFL